MAAKMVTAPTVHTTDLSSLSANVCFVAQQGEGQRKKHRHRLREKKFFVLSSFAFINRPLTSPASHPFPVLCPVCHTFNDTITTRNYDSALADPLSGGYPLENPHFGTDNDEGLVNFKCDDSSLGLWSTLLFSGVFLFCSSPSVCLAAHTNLNFVPWGHLTTFFDTPVVLSLQTIPPSLIFDCGLSLVHGFFERPLCVLGCWLPIVSLSFFMLYLSIVICLLLWGVSWDLFASVPC